MKKALAFFVVALCFVLSAKELKSVMERFT